MRCCHLVYIVREVIGRGCIWRGGWICRGEGGYGGERVDMKGVWRGEGGY